MKNIAIFGAGGLGRETVCFLNILNKEGADWNFIGFFDDGVEKGTQVSHFGKVLGGVGEINSWQEELALIIAIGNPSSVRGVRERIDNKKVYFPNIIAPNVEFTDEQTLTMGEGNIIGGNCRFTCDVRIGSFNLFNSGVIVGHDAVIGDYNILMPEVRISGEVKIGDCNLFGIASIVLQQIKVGNNVRLGAGSVLMTKPKDGNLYMGNPAKLFKY